MDDQHLAESTSAVHPQTSIGDLYKSKDLLARIALQLANLTRFEDKVDMILGLTGANLQVSRVYIFEDDHEQGVTNNTFEWCAQGVSPEIHNLQGIPISVIQEWYDVIGTNGYLSANDISTLPPNIRDILEPQGIVSIVVFKLILPGGETGFIGFDECKAIRQWRKDELDILITIASILQSLYEQEYLQQKLHENELNFQSMFNTITDFIFVADLDGNIVAFNKAVQERLLPKEPSGNPRKLHILDFHHEKNQQAAVEVLSDMMNGGSARCHIPLKCSDGREIPVETTVWFGEWNHQRAIFGISKDRSAEQNALDMFNRLFDNNPLPMWVIEAKTDAFLKINQAFKTTTGLGEEDVLGRKPENLGITIEGPVELDNTSADTLATPRGVHATVRVQGRGFATGILSRTVVSTQDKQLLLGVFTDLTKQIKMQNDLLEQKTKLEHIIESTNFGTWEWDIPTGKIQVNKRWAQIMGYTLEELGETSIETWRKMVHPEDIGKAEEQLELHFRGEIPYYSTEYRVIHKSGALVWLLDTGKVMRRDVAGKPLSMFGAHSDITHAKRIEMDLLAAKLKAEQLNELKTKFIAMLSHEIRTPVHTITGIAELLDLSVASERQQLYTDRLKKAALILLDTVNNLLDISRLEAGKAEIKHQAFSLQHLVEDIVQVHAIRCAQKKLELFLEIDPDTPLDLTGDPTRITQILVNLLGNAEKFTPTGRIVLSVRPVPQVQNSEQTFVEFSVADTGIGIQESKLADIFTEYYRIGSDGREAPIEGTGLGLSLTRQLVELLGGWITVDSKVGCGSTFAATLPFPMQRSGTPRSLVLTRTEAEPLPPIYCVASGGGQTTVGKILGQLGIPFSPVSTTNLVELDFCHDTRPLIIIDYGECPQNPKDMATVSKFATEHPDCMMILLTPVLSDNNWHEIPVRHRVVPKPTHFFNVFHAILDSVDNGQQGKGHPLRTGMGADKPNRLLVCEDHLVNGEILKELLESMGQTVTLVNNGYDAIEQLKSQQFALLFLDIQMPGIDGFETARRIRNELESTIPIVALSAHALDEYKQHSVAAGIDKYLVKPITPPMLLSVLDAWLGPASGHPLHKQISDTGKLLQSLAKRFEKRIFSTYGIRFNESLERCSYCIQTYRRHLRNLAGELSSLEQMCTSKDSDTRTIRHSIHAVRGIAANLGFEKFNELLAGYEQLRDFESEGQKQEIYGKLVVEIKEQLETTNQFDTFIDRNFGEHVPSQSKDSQQAANINLEETQGASDGFEALAGSLSQALALGDVQDSLQCITAIEHLAISDKQISILAEIRNLVQTYDFPSASSLFGSLTGCTPQASGNL